MGGAWSHPTDGERGGRREEGGGRREEEGGKERQVVQQEII